MQSAVFTMRFFALNLIHENRKKYFILVLNPMNFIALDVLVNLKLRIHFRAYHESIPQ